MKALGLVVPADKKIFLFEQKMPYAKYLCSRPSGSVEVDFVIVFNEIYILQRKGRNYYLQ
jgi:hypothetical protein